MIRDAGLCQWPITGAGRCGHPARDVDHRDNPADHSEFNLWCLCGKHHDEKTRREAYAGRTFQRRSAEAHPGLIDRPEPENRPW